MNLGYVIKASGTFGVLESILFNENKELYNKNL